MATDNTVLQPGAGGDTARTLLDSGGTVKWPAGVCAYVTGGSAGAWTLAPVDLTHGLPIQPATGATFAVTGTFFQATQPVSIAGNQAINIVQVAGAAIAAGHGTAAGAVRVELPTDGTGQVNAVQSGSWTVTISGTVTFANATIAVTNTGTFAVQAAQTGTWTVTTNADAPVTAGAAPSKALLMAGQFNTSLPTLTTGQVAAAQFDSSGRLIVNVGAGSAGNGAASNTGSAVPAQADYLGVNIGGTLRGQTGVNVTGTVYAAQMDLTSVAGTAAVMKAASTAAVVTDPSFVVALSPNSPVVTNAESAIGAATAPAKSIVIGGVYNTSLPTPTNGQAVTMQMDASGRQIIHPQSPAMTFNTVGDIKASGTIAASGTSTSAVDASAKWQVQLAVSVVFGTVAATSGVQVDVFRRFGSGPTDDTISVITFVIPSTTSTTKQQSFTLPTGKYDVKLTNLDGTNAVTAVTITSSTVDSVG